jgi:peroxiredoxin
MALALAAGAGLAFRGATVPVVPESSPVGRAVADFALRDPRGKVHTLHDLADRPIVVLVFTGCRCPLARLYGPRLAELAREFEPQGVAFLGINSNTQDSLADVAAYAKTHGIPFPILKDPEHTLADAVGAVRTPEVFVLDADRVVRYWGRIDDQYAVGVQRPRTARRDLAEALADLLAGRPVARPAVPSAGCRIGRLPASPSKGTVTYSTEIIRIVERRCTQCHRPGAVAPFPLTEYRDVRAWSAMIREVVAEGRMPPWFADPAHGTFRNDARLTPDEKRLLLAWIDAGCAEGEPAPAVAATPTDGWRIPRPDCVLPMAAEPFVVPAEGELAYQYFTVDPGFTEDRFLTAVEVRPGNPAVVHHALVSIQAPGADEGRLDNVGALLDYAPGMPPAVLPEGYAIRVPAGAKFVFQIHYTASGSPQQDLTRIGLVFADPAAVRHVVRGGAVVNPALAIPPGAAEHRVIAEETLQRDALLLSLSPHMHLRGKSFRFEAVHPGGRRETLLEVPRYDFNWQLRYDLAVPKRLAAGTRLVCTAVYDNSAGNPANPDPTQLVRWGEQTWEEMLIGFYAFVWAE